MWSNVKDHFSKYPAQQKVAQRMLEYGISVRGNQPYCGDVQISYSALAKACGTDRRIVSAAIETINADKFLMDIFGYIRPTASYKDMAKAMGWGVLEIIPEDVNEPGIISKVTGVLANRGINIRQFIADDPDISDNPRSFIITESRIPGALLQKIKDVPGVSAVVIY